MPSVEEHLRADVGGLLTSLLFQNALLKAEVDTLKQQLQQQATAPSSDGRVEARAA